MAPSCSVPDRASPARSGRLPGMREDTTPDVRPHGRACAGLFEESLEDCVLGPDVPLVPHEIAIPVPRAIVHRAWVIGVADLDDERSGAVFENEVERHALRAGAPGDLEGDPDALGWDAIEIVDDSAAAGSAEVAGANVAREAEGAVADCGHPDVVVVSRHEILEVDIAAFGAESAVDRADGRERPGESSDGGQELPFPQRRAVSLRGIAVVGSRGPETAREGLLDERTGLPGVPHQADVQRARALPQLEDLRETGRFDPVEGPAGIVEHMSRGQGGSRRLQEIFLSELVVEVPAGPRAGEGQHPHGFGRHDHLTGDELFARVVVVPVPEEGIGGPEPRHDVRVQAIHDVIGNPALPAVRFPAFGEAAGAAVELQSDHQDALREAVQPGETRSSPACQPRGGRNLRPWRGYRSSSLTVAPSTSTSIDEGGKAAM